MRGTRTVIACFDNHPPVEYTRGILRSLISDPNCRCICDGQTGEVIYEREESEDEED